MLARVVKAAYFEDLAFNLRFLRLDAKTSLRSKDGVFWEEQSVSTNIVR